MKTKDQEAPEENKSKDNVSEEDASLNTSNDGDVEEEDEGSANTEDTDDADIDTEGDDDIETLKADRAKLLKETMKRKAALKAAEKKAEEAAAALAAYEGIDPAKVKALLKAEKDAEAAEAEARGDFDRVKSMMVDEHNREKDSLQEQIDALTAAREADRKAIAELTIGNNFSSSNYIREELLLTPTKARALYGNHFETVDGKVVGYDKPAGQADRTPLVDANGENVSFDAAMKRLIEADPDRDTLLRVKLKPGGGSSTTSNDTVNKPAVKNELFGVSRIAANLGDFSKKT